MAKYIATMLPHLVGGFNPSEKYESQWEGLSHIWAMVNTHYMVDGHPIHNKDPYNGYYKSLWTIGWLAPINGY